MTEQYYCFRNHDHPGFTWKKFWQLCICLMLGVLVMSIFIGFICVSMGWCGEYSDQEIADAIYIIEGADKAQFAYGIRSVQCFSLTEARQVCLNTIANQRKRHVTHRCGKDILRCLADRYCPVGCDNDRGTNKYWLSNLRKQLARLK